MVLYALQVLHYQTPPLSLLAQYCSYNPTATFLKLKLLHQLSNLNQRHFARHFPIKPTTWGGPARSRERSASQVSIPSNGSHERSGRRTPHLYASRGVFAPQGRMNLEAGPICADVAKTDSWNRKRTIGCCNAGPEKERNMREG